MEYCKTYLNPPRMTASSSEIWDRVTTASYMNTQDEAFISSYPCLTFLRMNFIWLMGMRHLKKLDEEK
jgi:hypothetical protein